MNSIQALIRNMRTCRSDVKGEAQVEAPRGESTKAEHRGGSARSSDEVSVMETEQRGCIIIQFYLTVNCEGGTVE